ncbi:hypothetical protein CGGC5_v007044 [Colletotrichum fructicola Nara gc5]|uniref:Ankyrin repeat protein n=2 Tax=Colletotrichum fructicola (strain Nara gc5) TaxID=1213859 RepID=A0A7J6J5V2_COLFN|nr:hypothetical protein CGGC5_v007044 [Colletotrichum fructicola Nara gc5]
MGNVERQDEVLSGLKTQDEVIDLKKSHIYLTSFTESEYGTGPDGRGMRTRDAQLGPMELLDLDDINTSKKLSENRGWIHIPANDIEMAEACMRILTNDDVAKSVRESWERKLRPKIPDLTKPLPTHAWNLDASVEKEVTNTTVEVTPMVKADTQLASSLDIMSSVFSPSGIEPYWKWYNLVTAILARSVMGIFQVTGDKLGDPLAIYRWAIANKTARHATLLEAFWKRRLSQAAGGRSDEGSEELELALELADILDELNILKRFLDQQYITHLKAVRILGHNGNLEERDQLPAMNSRKAEVRGLVADAEQTHRMVLELLDLELKAASLSEARTTTRQGQAVMLFTIITIIFLPLSFFVSYFGQNVSELTGDSQNPTSGQVWKIAAPISAVVIVFALAVSFVIMDPWKSWKDFAVKIYRSFLGRLRKWRGVKDMETRHPEA